MDFVLILFVVVFAYLFCVFFRSFLKPDYRIIKVCCLIISIFLVFTVVISRLGFRNIKSRDLHDMVIAEGYIHIDENIFGLLENGGIFNYYDVELISEDHSNQTAVNKLKKYNEKYAKIWYYEDGIEGHNPTKIIYQIYVENELHHEIKDSNYNIDKDDFYVHEKVFILVVIALFTVILYGFIWKIICFLIR